MDRVNNLKMTRKRNGRSIFNLTVDHDDLHISFRVVRKKSFDFLLYAL